MYPFLLSRPALVVLFALLAAVGVLGSPAPSDGNRDGTSRPHPELRRASGGRVLARPARGADPTAVRELFQALGLRVTHHFPALRGIVVLELKTAAGPEAPASGHSGVDAAVAALRSSPLIDFAEPDTTGRALFTPNDPHFTGGNQWALRNTAMPTADIMAETAWDLLRESPEIVVAVVDSGIRLTHEDLAANLWVNPGESGTDSLGRDKRTNGVDDDRNGYVDDVHGVNVLNGTGNPSDDWGHGTHVAGIVGAVGNNGRGIAGVTWRVKLMGCKFIDAAANYTASDAVIALDYARANGARVITGAWGKTAFTSTALREAVIALRDANIILAAATGNDGSDNDVTPLFPASYEYSNVIAAAATDAADGLAGFSHYGARTVDLGAPGADILSCWADSDSSYRQLSGTSFAAAYVAGACALVWARFPGYSHQDVIARILSTVDPLPSLAGRTVSGGRLNLAAALGLGSPPSITSAATANGTRGAAFSYQITASNTPTSYAATGLAGSGLTLNAATGLISGAPANAGTLTTQVTASNAAGSSAPMTLTITVVAPGTAPAITSASSAQATVGAAFTYQITASESPTSYAATNLAGSGLALNASTGVISGTPGAAGTITSQLTATNTIGTSAPVTLTITVAAAGSRPTISSGTAASARAGTAFTYQITASESPTSYAATNLAGTGLALNASTGLISGTPGAAGTITSQLTATNTTGTSAPVTLTITVAAAGSAPVITSALSASVKAGASFSYTLTAAPSPTTLTVSDLPPGLSYTTPTVSGTVSAAGTYSLTLTATNAFGSDTRTLALTVEPATPVDTRVDQQIQFVPGAAILGEPATLTATSSAGLPVSFALVSGRASLVGATLTPQDGHAIVVRAYNDGNASTRPASTDVTIPVHQRQTLTFDSPVGNLVVNAPVELSATTSAGNLPITFTLVRGNATLSGGTLTPRGAGEIIVRASQAGTDVFLPAAVERSLGSPGRLAQVISCPEFSDTTTVSGPLLVDARTDSGRPVVLTVSGPARVEGRTLVLTGVPGTVTLRVSAAGDDIYNAATEVVRRFQVRAAGPQVYLGSSAGDRFALVVSADGQKGFFILRLAAYNEALVARFTLDAAGTFQATASSHSAAATAFTASPAISGAVNNGVASGTISGIDRRFSANLSSQAGPAAAWAGAYNGYITGSASGEVWLVAASDSWAFALVATPTGVSSGLGALGADGAFAIDLDAGGTFSGMVSAETGAVQGSLRQGGRNAPIAGWREGTERSDRLVNLSTRLRVVGGDSSRSVIGGFVVGGDRAKPVLVRAVGPGLKGYGIQNALANPRLQLYRGRTIIAENEDWGNDPAVRAAAERVLAFKLDADSRDAALLVTLEPGAYTAIVTGENGSGVVLVEIYDAVTGAPTRSDHLLNCSTRGFVDTGEGNVIAGFVVAGNAPKRVLIRGIGPALSAYDVAGAVENPTLRVYAAGSDTVIAQNDDWGTGAPVNAHQTVASVAELSAAAASTGAFPLPTGSKDAALVITLAPGTYTAVVSGANATTGVCLVEVYEISHGH